MAVFLVTWDFNKENPATYSRKREHLLRILSGLNYRKDTGLDSVVFVAVPNTATQLYNHLAPAFDKNDRLLVTRLNNGEMHSYMNKEIHNWINSNLS